MDRAIYNFYRNDANSKKIIQQLQDREFSMFFPRHIDVEGYRGQRFMRLEEKDRLSWVFGWSHQMRRKHPLNLFMSLAKFKDLPTMRWKTEENIQYRKTWAENWVKWIKSYDFVVDIDSPSHEFIDLAKDNAMQILDELEDLFGKRGQIRFSGKGFHIYYYYDMIKDHFPDHSFDPMQNNNIYNQYCFIAKKLKEKITDFIDTSIYDCKRVIKIPASLVFYPENKIYYACVLTKNQLHNFDLEKYGVCLDGKDERKKL